MLVNEKRSASLFARVKPDNAVWAKEAATRFGHGKNRSVFIDELLTFCRTHEGMFMSFYTQAVGGEQVVVEDTPVKKVAKKRSTTAKKRKTGAKTTRKTVRKKG